MSERSATAPGGWTRTIVAINPSHENPIESTFWCDFAAACTAAGWRLVQIAARRIPSVADADTFTFPARLAEFHRWAPRIDHDVPWLDQDTTAVQVDWEHRRWDLGLHEPTVWTAVGQLAAVLDLAIETLRPAVVLTTNKIDHPCALGRAAAQHHGVPVVGLIERSPFESVWFEPDGLFAESTIWDPQSRWRSVDEPGETGRRVVDRLRANPSGFRAAEVTSRRADLGGLRRPVVFVPLDNILWTGWLPEGHPQGVRDYPILRTPASAVGTIADWVDEVGGSLIVKSHPSCLESAKLLLPPVARFVDGSLVEIVAASDVTVAFNTKVAFASLALGNATVTLADNPAAAAGHTFHWSAFGTPADAMAAALEGTDRDTDSALADFFGRLELGHFYGRDRDGGDAAASMLLADLVRASEAASLEAHDANACEELRRLLTPSDARPESARLGRSRRRVVLVADRLVDPNAQASGIARYGWELVSGLEAEDRVDLRVLLREPSVGWHRGTGPLFQRLRRMLGSRLVTVSKSEREDVVLEGVGTLGPGDVVHSIHLPLPSHRVTGDALRVLTVHDVLHLARPDFHAADGPPTIERIVQSIDSGRDVLICDSQHTRRDLMSIGPYDGDRVAAILLGVTPPCPCPGLDVRTLPASWDGYVVMMLQSEPRKNSPAMLDALRVVLDSLATPRIGVVAVGPVSAVRQYRDELDAFDPSQLVSFTDATDHEIHHLLRGAQAFVYASLYEGFGLPPLEAMAAGCPVVVVPNSSLVEVVGDAGLYAHSGSADDIAAALRLLLRSASLRDELVRRGHHRADELTWTRTVRETIAVYERFTGRVGAAA